MKHQMRAAGQTTFLRSWWVIMFILLCFMVYEQGVKKRNEHYAHLAKQLTELKKEKEWLIANREDLKLRIDSFDDPAWIELSLMKVLGLIPEGYEKVYFTPEND